MLRRSSLKLRSGVASGAFWCAEKCPTEDPVSGTLNTLKVLIRTELLVSIHKRALFPLKIQKLE